MTNYFTSLVEENRIAVLTKQVFNQRLEKDSQSSFVQVLSLDEEKAVISQFLKTKSADWLKFIREYVNHYPLNPNNFVLLVDDLKTDSVKKFVADYLKMYGTNEKESLAICKKIRETEDFDESFLTTFCSTARHYYKTVSYQFDDIDEKWNKMYNDAIAQNSKLV